jgi:hypothetical protein
VPTQRHHFTFLGNSVIVVADIGDVSGAKLGGKLHFNP